MTRLEHARAGEDFMGWRLHLVVFAALLNICLAESPLNAATIGSTQKVQFGYMVIGSFCTIDAKAGSLGVEKKRGLITSDSTVAGDFNGNRAAATISVVSNLTSAGTIIVDPPVLTGGTAATASELRIGNSAYSTASRALNLGVDGGLANTSLNVRFSTTSNGGRFANGTYGAVATITCTDNSRK